MDFGDAQDEPVVHDEELAASFGGFAGSVNHPSIRWALTSVVRR